ncbi:MAG: RNA polymerase, sigma-24 subunit, ECF subfamily, RNA polymerase sigma-70 factor, ECF subfamily [Candidatus Gottesmanbacteria bacterium GW2011_GWA2_43_14]|uniref:RNA polymerase, sigma-24 subunit, ECF subfamily, RNA polymerase sigma-70 factor, ECF subfamily n=1 Tax=Candidatus Gottesmanbacteria bacterium GW2011_GWA2_43_14 TaxID=1618443 RepID=A0A0G1DJX6_9BACT|nr:MAG: RNA polymerase, sigma-24 subunit, ECF subfamily, RNA polymerase sigma-70 factor, ECF subfamily [Candidatus Gottesmanbacteria bacterium GW2011_GWA2_43_14]
MKRSPDLKTERKIVYQILRGDEAALTSFYKKYHPSLYTYISKKINTKEDIEEILQDSLLATIEALRDFSFKCSLFTFVCSIANHKIIDFYRRKKIQKIVFSKFEGFEPLLSTIFGPEEILDEEILKQRIKQTFRKLTPTYQVILKLKYVYGYSVEEIAEKLSITFKSAESQLFRARKAFASYYAYGE